MIESIFKFISNLVLSFTSILKILFRSKIFYKRALITEDYCFILGNGPSLKNDLNDNLEIFKNSNLLCVNGFSSSNYFDIVKPKYYVFTDPSIWSKKTTDLENIKIRSAMVNSLILKTTWNLNLFLPTISKQNSKFIESFRENQNIRISYFNTTPIEGITRINWFFYQLGLGMPRPHNVVIPSLMIAINSNVKTIGLFGVDHSWIPLIHVDQNNNTLLKQEHFYDEKNAKATHMKLGEAKKMLHEMLYSFYNIFSAYVIIKPYADKNGVSIYNTTENSFIDAFERKSLPELLEKISNVYKT